MTESLEEIMTDKLISFVNTTKYVRNRDIWDLRWLKQRGSKINFAFISAKIQDYQITDYPRKLKKRIHEIDEIIKGKKFHDEMSRFIPTDVQERTQQKEKFKNFLITEIKGMLIKVNLHLQGDQHNDEFEM